MTRTAGLWKLATSGGCAAKLGPFDLDKLILGIDFHSCRTDMVIAGQETHDDAAIVALSEDKWTVLTTDFISPASDDPFTYGQIAAANALSDVYAMGGLPLVALNICCFPRQLELRDEVRQVLRGAATVAQSAGAEIVGGHTIVSSAPFYGLAVTGVVTPRKVRYMSGAKVGQALILTKPLGTGVYISAYKQGLINAQDFVVAEESMITLNSAASDVIAKYSVGGCTDITGFGLAGHAVKMAKASKVGIRLCLEAVPVFERVAQLTAMGVSTRNTDEIVIFVRDYLRGGLQNLDSYAAILFDPQTSGGLLISVPAHDAETLVEELRGAGMREAAIVGEVVSGDSVFVEVY